MTNNLFRYYDKYLNREHCDVFNTPKASVALNTKIEIYLKEQELVGKRDRYHLPI